MEKKDRKNEREIGRYRMIERAYTKREKERERHLYRKRDREKVLNTVIEINTIMRKKNRKREKKMVRY